METLLIDVAVIFGIFAFFLGLLAVSGYLAEHGDEVLMAFALVLYFAFAGPFILLKKAVEWIIDELRYA